MALCYRQRVEKSAGGEMLLALWSPKMDLLAAVFKDHSVVLNRLSWQRVWTVAAAESPVAALAWRPDGKVLAVGRGDGSVCLHSVEDGRWLHQFTAGAAITDLWWGEERACSLGEEACPSQEAVLPALPALDGNLPGSFTEKGRDGTSEEAKHPHDPKQLATLSKSLNVLLAGDEVGRVHICVSGVFLAATMATKSYEESGHVILTWMSHDLKAASNLVLEKAGQEAKLILHTVNTSFLGQRSAELHHVALKFGQLSSLLEYVRDTLHAMHEAWEDVLVMMDSKLASYSRTLPPGQSVSDELLLLLACGRARPELQTFLIDELTAKGLKKLGLSLEHSYINIRRYSLTNLSSAIQSLQYHLSEVLGMARSHERFGKLGLCESSVLECINSLGAFALKSQEMLHAIDSSLKSIKVFFKWLFVVIHKLSNETIPAALKEHLSPVELQLMLDFLRKRVSKGPASGEEEEEGGRKQSSLNLEVVGQYLADEELKYTDDSPPAGLWARTLQDAGLGSAAVPWLFQPQPRKSLVQLFRSLHRHIDTAFAQPMAAIQSSFCSELLRPLASFKLKEGSLHKTAQELRPVITHFVFEDCCYVCFRSGLDVAVVTYGTSDERLQCAKFFVCKVPSLPAQQEAKCEVLSLQRYSESTLSILLRCPSPLLNDSPGHAIAQIPIEGVVSLPMTTITTMTDLADVPSGSDLGPYLLQVLTLGHFKAGRLAVSGSRQLAAVLSSTGKKVRLFDVDAEEEEEEEDT